MPETIVSPFSLGGGGVRFELLVAVSYLTNLLRHEIPRGLAQGLVETVKLQQRNQGCPVDDIVVSCGQQGTLYVQAKHKITFSDNAEFRKVIAEAWTQWKSASVPDSDRIGLAIGEACYNQNVRTHVRDVLDWARSSHDAAEYVAKIGKFKAKQTILSAFEGALCAHLGKTPKKADLWRFLKQFDVIPFDYASESGRDTILCRNTLLRCVWPRDPRHGETVFAVLYGLASEYAPQAGTISRDTLRKRLGTPAGFSVPPLDGPGKSVAEILPQRLQERIDAEIASRKYIPGVFIEPETLKEKARLFCDPALFLRKLADDIQRIDLFELNRLFETAGLSPISFKPPSLTTSVGFDSAGENAAILRDSLDGLVGALGSRTRDKHADMLREVPEDKRFAFDELFDSASHLAQATIDKDVLPLQELVRFSTARVMAIVSRAGQGKTNFVCDLAEQCLAPRGIPCVLLMARELNRVKGDLESSVARLLSPAGTVVDVENVLKTINEEARRKGTRAVVIIDALNEHDDIQTFSGQIEAFIAHCLTYSHVCVIATCRSEYFEARFGNLLTSSFAGNLIREDDIQSQMDAAHKRQLVDGYFRHFNIRCVVRTAGVSRELANDPLLLRIFCETYGSERPEESNEIPILDHVRREPLFRAYLGNKLNALESKRTRRDGCLVGGSNPFHGLLSAVVAEMLTDRVFANLAVSRLPNDKMNILSELVDEDLLLRRDLETTGAFGAASEVISFTFDAMRDYVLAGHLIDVVLPEDSKKFEGQVRALTASQSTVAEGLQDFLFCYSRNLKRTVALPLIEKMPWYDSVFARCIYDLEDAAINDRDLVQFKSRCERDEQYATDAIVRLCTRYDTSRNTRLNITVMFDLFESLPSETFQRICHKAFMGPFSAGVWDEHGAIFPLEELVLFIRASLRDDGAWQAGYLHLATLLLYLWGLSDGGHDYPAQNAYAEFERMHPSYAAQLKGVEASIKSRWIGDSSGNDWT